MALLPYHNTIRHQGRTFVLHTEDSGPEHAHVFTHVFAEGGRVVATKKTPYAEWIGRPDLAERVKALMQEQHKAAFIAVRNGLFDLDEEAGARAFAERTFEIEGMPTLTPRRDRPN